MDAAVLAAELVKLKAAGGSFEVRARTATPIPPMQLVVFKSIVAGVCRSTCSPTGRSRNRPDPSRIAQTKTPCPFRDGRFIRMVGLTGFEPARLLTPVKRANQAALARRTNAPLAAFSCQRSTLLRSLLLRPAFSPSTAWQPSRASGSADSVFEPLPATKAEPYARQCGSSRRLGVWRAPCARGPWLPNGVNARDRASAAPFDLVEDQVHVSPAWRFEFGLGSNDIGQSAFVKEYSCKRRSFER